MKIAFNKIFRMDDDPFVDEIFSPFNKLYEKKKS